MRKPNTATTRRASLAIAVVLAFATLAAAAQSSPENGGGPYSAKTRVDWRERVLRVNLELDLAAAGLRLPEGRLSAERMMERDMPGLAKDAVFALQADSHRTIEASVQDGSFGPDRLIALADLAKVERSSFTKDMRKFTATYVLSLDSIASLFLTGADPTPIRAPLESRIARDYTGIVIYAKGSLPVHGEDIDGIAAPCLFPRIYDSDMRLVSDRSYVAPEVLSRSGALGGVLGYASAIGVEAGSRVGGDPMRIMAVELFGDARTDYVISREDALRILSSPGNRELLRQGKVVVVLGL